MSSSEQSPDLIERYRQELDASRNPEIPLSSREQSERQQHAPEQKTSTIAEWRADLHQCLIPGLPTTALHWHSNTDGISLLARGVRPTSRTDDPSVVFRSPKSDSKQRWQDKPLNEANQGSVMLPSHHH